MPDFVTKPMTLTRMPKDPMMRRSILLLTALAALWSAPALAQSRTQLGPLCTTDTTPADQQIDACNKILALKVFSGTQLANIYFWRAVGWNKKGNYSQVIADASEAIKLKPDIAIYNLRGSAYYDKGEYDIAIADFNDALRMGGPQAGMIYHNRGNAWRGKGDYAKAIADYDASIKFDPKAKFSYQNRGVSKMALGDLDNAVVDINEAIRLDPALPSPLTKRAVIWRAKGDIDRAISDATEAIRLAKAKAPVNVMTPPGSGLIAAYVERGLAYEAKGNYASARQDYAATLEGKASDAGSKSNQATARVRLSLLMDATAPAPGNATSNTTSNAPSAPAASDATANLAPPPTPVQNTSTTRRVALVIGNSAYTHVTPLPNPVNDARSIAKSLRDIGFVVNEGINLDRVAMQSTIREFLREAARAQIAVVYYAGHGVQVEGRNYLVPIDVQFQADSRMTDAMVELDTIMAGLDDQVRTNILIMDACRNNPMTPPVATTQVASAGANRGIQPGTGLAAPASLGAGSTLGAGTLIAYATAPGQVALDGEGANSPFSAALSRHLGTPGLEVQQMLTRVRAEVVASTKSKQVPWSNSSLLGEVFLVEK